MRQFFASVLEIFEVTVIAIGAVALIRSFLVQPFLVSGSSMVPNFAHGDYLLVDELTYRFREPQRGEVAVFYFPKDESTYFIKRIIGLPGERVVIEGGTIRILDEANPEAVVLKEKYLAPGTMLGGDADVTLGESEYFVLGDNRSFSFDSRSWGTLERDHIVGLVRFRLWPIANAMAFGAPQY